ncbi:MAG: hypothetical protein KF760_10490 [Candidatus Eremiobacteraeota bacterium]|nr:hypothetical protein [Candidatus Eremiobacteraeota bacterium]MCW5870111.1 hypothetical protein [Candidatus Eremiobacteraeota bacterium]
MEQNLDLSKWTLGEIAGEHFLRVTADESLAQVVDKLRDHQCAAAIYSDNGAWRVVSAEILPELLLKGPDALQQPVSALAQPLMTLASSDSLSKLSEALQKNTWVGACHGGEVKSLLHWTSWARFTATHRVAKPYLFSPEWGSDQKASLAKV